MTEAPECAKRLVLRECLEQRQREAKLGVCDTGRYRCRYVDWGRGPTLVMIPGLASDALSFVMAMARLSAHFRCVSYDLPGGAGDGAHLMKYRHADLATDLFALLDHLDIRTCSIYGASFGSTIALTAIQHAPHRFTHGILQAGFARRRLATTEVLAASFVRFLPGRVAQLPLVRAILERNHRQPFRAREQAVWDFYLERAGATPLRAFASRLLMVHRVDLRAVLPTIQTPILLVCGDHDPLVGKSCEEELMRGLPRARRAEIEHCGHEPHLTHPEVLAEVISF